MLFIFQCFFKVPARRETAEDYFSCIVKEFLEDIVRVKGLPFHSISIYVYHKAT